MSFLYSVFMCERTAAPTRQQRGRTQGAAANASHAHHVATETPDPVASLFAERCCPNERIWPGL